MIFLLDHRKAHSPNELFSSNTNVDNMILPFFYPDSDKLCKSGLRECIVSQGKTIVNIHNYFSTRGTK